MMRARAMGGAGADRWMSGPGGFAGDFVAVLADDFAVHGAGAVAELRRANPGAYLRLCASVLRHKAANRDPLEDLTDAELAARRDAIGARLAALGGGPHPPDAGAAPRPPRPPGPRRAPPRSASDRGRQGPYSRSVVVGEEGMATFGFGQTVSRKEDDRLLRGAGAYTDDAALPGQAHGIVLRSPHAHARIDRLDAARARAAPGVLAILTAAEARADGLGTQPCFAPTVNLDGSPYVSPPHPLLAQDTVRHVGDPVAFVVAETRERAREAADLVDIDDAVLAATTDTAAALSIAQGAGQAPPAIVNGT